MAAKWPALEPQLPPTIEQRAARALWLELIIEGKLMKKELVEALWMEADEIVAIMTSSRKSAGRSLVADQAKSKIKFPKFKI